MSIHHYINVYLLHSRDGHELPVGWFTLVHLQLNRFQSFKASCPARGSTHREQGREPRVLKHQIPIWLLNEPARTAKPVFCAHLYHLLHKYPVTFLPDFKEQSFQLYLEIKTTEPGIFLLEKHTGVTLSSKIWNCWYLKARWNKCLGESTLI